MKTLLLMVLFLVGLGVIAQEVKEPDALVKARETYQKDVARAMLPLVKDYTGKLEKMKKDLGAKGDAVGAMSVQKEIDAVAPKPVAETKKPEAKGKLTIVGKWRQSNGFVWNFFADGKMTVEGWGRGTWIIQDDGSIYTTRRHPKEDFDQHDALTVEAPDRVLSAGGSVFQRL